MDGCRGVLWGVAGVGDGRAWRMVGGLDGGGVCMGGAWLEGVRRVVVVRAWGGGGCGWGLGGRGWCVDGGWGVVEG